MHALLESLHAPWQHVCLEVQCAYYHLVVVAVASVCTAYCGEPEWAEGVVSAVGWYVCPVTRMCEFFL